MKMNNLLHPEIVLNKRGDYSLRQLYIKILKNIEYSIDGFSYIEEKNVLSLRFNNESHYKRGHIDRPYRIVRGKRNEGLYTPNCFILTSLVSELDQNSQNHFCLIKKFCSEYGKVYKFGRELLPQIENSDHKNIILKLPNKFLGYISFPNNSIKDETGFSLQGVYVFVGDAHETPFSDCVYKHSKLLWCSFIRSCDNINQNKIDFSLQKINNDFLKSLYNEYQKNSPLNKVFNLVNLKNELVFNNNKNISILLRLISFFEKKSTLEKVPSCLNLSYKQKIRIEDKFKFKHDFLIPVFFFNSQNK